VVGHGGRPDLQGAAALRWTSLRREVVESVWLEILELLVVVELSRDSWTRRIERRRVELRAAVVRSAPASGARRGARRIEAQGVQGSAVQPL
jgi:hypothetical protein